MHIEPGTPRQTQASPARPKRADGAVGALRIGLLSLIAPLALVACNDPAPPLPRVTPADVVAPDPTKDRAVTAGSARDASVPPAASVVTPPAGDPQAAEGPALAPLTKEEETQAMPKDGQANDHSTPKMGS